MMRGRRNSFTATILFTLCLLLSGSRALATDADNNDLRFEEAKVVEVSDSHISVIAQTGVEHVIALDQKGTTVLAEGKKISPKMIKEGDIVTIILDAESPVKLARNINLEQSSGHQIARANR